MDSSIDIKPALAHYVQEKYIKCWSEQFLSEEATEFVVGDDECNDVGSTVMDLSRFSKLKKISIGNNAYNTVSSLVLTGLTELESISIGNACFQHINELKFDGLTKLVNLTIGENCFNKVNELKIEDLSKLERVRIGRNSFTRTGTTGNPSRNFSLKNCPMLKEVQIGVNSFSDYTNSYIENLASLESIVFGAVDEDSNNFYNVREATFMSNGVKGE